jgi:hypothetical protein
MGWFLVLRKVNQEYIVSRHVYLLGEIRCNVVPNILQVKISIFHMCKFSATGTFVKLNTGKSMISLKITTACSRDSLRLCENLKHLALKAARNYLVGALKRALASPVLLLPSQCHLSKICLSRYMNLL